MVAAEEEEGRCGGGVGVGEEETAEVATAGMRERERERKGSDRGERDWGTGWQPRGGRYLLYKLFVGTADD